YKSVEEAALLPVLPRQTRTPCNSCWRRSCARLNRRHSRCSGGGGAKLCELRERLPSSHPLAPPDIGWHKAAGVQPFAHFLLGENAQTRSSPINMNHRHNSSFY